MTKTRSPRRRGLRLLGVLAALSILLLSVLTSQGGGARAGWFSQGFQVLNAESQPLAFVARFLAPDGSVASTLTDTLPAGAVRFYRGDALPTPLPDNFTGTLSLDAPGSFALSVLHLSEAITGANMLLEGAPAAALGSHGYIPYEPCMVIYAHNLADISVTVTLLLLDHAGMPVASNLRDLPPDALADLTSSSALPPGFAGGAVVSATGPIEVIVRWRCDGGESFVAPPQGDRVLYMPFVPPNLPGLITTTLAIMNTSATNATTGTVSFCNGATYSFSLPPLGSATVPSLLLSLDGSAVVRAGQPLAATVQASSLLPELPGSLFYRAVGQHEAARSVAVPIVLNGYQGWSAGSRLWLQNTTDRPISATLRYVTTASAEAVWQVVSLPPLQALPVTIPSLEGELAAALLRADQPVAVLSGARNLAALEDPWVFLPGTYFTTTCEPLRGADFSWQPVTPSLGQEIAFTATADGSAPFSYAWDLGDGRQATGQTITHTYAQPGIYTVTLTATNCLEFGQATAAKSLTVVCEQTSAADFSWQPVTPSLGQEIAFTATADGSPPFSYTWDLGDGRLAAGQTVTHTYAQAGVYTVTLTATNCLGQGRATAVHLVGVLPRPTQWRIYLPIVFK